VTEHPAKFTKEQKLALRTIIYRTIEKAAIEKPSQVARDAKYLALQDLRKSADEVAG
jgi:hypothetical protein